MVVWVGVTVYAKRHYFSEFGSTVKPYRYRYIRGSAYGPNIMCEAYFCAKEPQLLYNNQWPWAVTEWAEIYCHAYLAVYV